MTEHDFEAFAMAFGAAWDFHKPLSDRAIMVAFRQLAAYPIATVLAAIDAHMTDSARGQYAPKPADLIAQIEKHTLTQQRLSADEAWALIPTREEDSAVLTSEMLEAWGVASALLPDGVAARMAFRAAYERCCEANRLRGIPVQWSVSQGWSKDNLETVVLEAHRLGRLTREQAGESLRELEYKSPMVQGLLSSPEMKRNPEVAKEFLSKLREITKTPDPAEFDRVAILAELDAMGARMRDAHHG